MYSPRACRRRRAHVGARRERPRLRASSKRGKDSPATSRPNAASHRPPPAPGGNRNALRFRRTALKRTRSRACRLPCSSANNDVRDLRDNHSLTVMRPLVDESKTAVPRSDTFLPDLRAFRGPDARPDDPPTCRATSQHAGANNDLLN